MTFQVLDSGGGRKKMYQLEKIRKKYTVIRNLVLIRNKFNRILNFFHIY